MLNKPIIFLFLFSMVACQNSDVNDSDDVTAAADLNELEFLLGKWHVSTDFPKYVYESWEKKSDTEFSGLVYEINRLGDSSVREELTIKLTDKGVLYLVDFNGEALKDTFFLKDSKSGAVFEDPENDFPQTISYLPHDRGITVVLEGGKQRLEMSYEDPERSDSRKRNGLGSFVQIALGVEDIETEREFFEMLGFRVIVQSEEPYPFYQMTNDALILNISKDGMEYYGLAYFDKAMGDRVSLLEEDGHDIVMKETLEDGSFNFGVIDDPDGYGIGLINYDPWQMMQGNIRRSCDLGQFGEFTFPVENIDQSIAWYESVGFELDGRYEQPYPWAIMNDGKMMVGLHQTGESYFQGPSMTFFSIQSSMIIEGLVEKGLSPLAPDEWNFEGETTNAIFTSPGGNQVSVFFGAL